MGKKFVSRLLSLVLSAALLLGCLPAAAAADRSGTQALRFTQTESGETQGDYLPQSQAEETEASVPYADTDLVRVSIVLKSPSTLEAGYAVESITESAATQAYRSKLRAEQETVSQRISRQVLDGEKLDVVWNLTLAANIISANVAYGDVEKIAAVPGVSQVLLEQRYEPCVVDREEAADPNMSTSTEMTGTTAAWAAGYTGAGSRIAIIDTGTDTDHQSFSEEGYLHALALNAQAAGEDLDSYLAGLHLLDAAEIQEKLPQLNIYATLQGKNYTASDLYRTEKLPFGFNYIDKSLDITHDNDSRSEHGSHVAGIAAANRFIPDGNGGFTNALESVKTQGVAPDAQILTMKVFGARGGAYESDYMVAIEDAIVLGCDAVNLSLGTGFPGWDRNKEDSYQQILEKLTESGIVAVMSAGNSGTWVENSKNSTGYLYATDVSMTTTGSPGTSRNALSVASVDNVGSTGYYLKSGESMIFYGETEYKNVPMATLAGEQKYILIDGYGTEEDLAALGDAVQGKILACSRGSISFYQKGNFAAAAGAIGTIVYNNQPGTINMDLTDYTYTAPCISITQADGTILRSNATAVKDGQGNTLYYEGTITVSSQVAVSRPEETPETYTMSSFSSWGIPGSLTMKPEITAPGGGIYSVNGKVPGGQAYENMSGTSMAAPQVTGMTALAAEYIRQTGLAEKTGKSARQLAQSLLMSTAEPLLDGDSGSYWPILQQGSGLANIDALLRADSYLTMGQDATASWADGKVKAELGDDPDRTGSYTFHFDIHNLKDTDQRYVLSSDFFTQGVFTEDGVSYLDTATTALAAAARYTVDGKVYEPTARRILCDLDGDGDTDAQDAAVILDYAAGNRADIDGIADLDGDGAVTTYDAYLLLQDLQTGTILVKGGASVSVEVTITLPESLRQELDGSYPNGAYLEGYVYAEPVSTEEGVVAATHSIPVLGFYGSWTDASMYDCITYTESLYGDKTASYLGYPATNNLIVKHPKDSSGYFQVGNPYLLEDTYPEGRAAIRSADTLYQYRISLIRNAAAITVRITDQDGEELYLGNLFDQANSAYYYTTSGSWTDTVSTYTMNRKVSSLGVKEGDEITVSVVAIPEYYETDGILTEQQVEDLIASGALGEGAYLSTTLTVDNTAPEMLSAAKDLATGDLIVRARDNNYIAAVKVLNSSGNEVLATAAASQSEKGGTAEAVVDLSGVKLGPTCQVLVADYAGNESRYTVNYGGEPEDYTGQMYAYTNSDYRGGGSRWMRITPEKLCYSSEKSLDGSENLDSMAQSVTAAEYAEGYVYMAAQDGKLYAAPQGEWGNCVEVGTLSPAVTVKDMAYDTQGKTLYALDDANNIYTVDRETAQLTLAFSVTVTNPKVTSTSASFNKYKVLANLTVDDEGNFYAVSVGNYTYYSFLYRWSLADVVDGAAALVPINNDKNGHSGFYTTYGSLAWDHDADVLYWATATSDKTPFVGTQQNKLFRFDLETGKASLVNTDYYTNQYPNIEPSQFYCGVTGLYIVPSGGGSKMPAAEEASRISISRESLSLLTGAEFQLSAVAFPWTLADKSITWSSSAPEVAAVEDGYVTAVAPGEATITATTSAAPNLTATCTVTVSDLAPLTLSGLLYDKDSKTQWVDFSTADPAQWTAFAEGQGSYYAGAMLDDMIYVHDGERLARFDPDTYEVEDLGKISESWIWSDAAPAPADENGNFGFLVGLCNGGTYLEMIKPQEGSLKYFSLTDHLADPMAAIAGTGSSTYQNKYPAENYLVVTESGVLWSFTLYTKDGGKNYTLARSELGQTDLDLGNVSDVTGGSYASMFWDESSGYLILASCAGETTASLYAIDPQLLTAAPLGDFGQGNWPVVSLYQHTRPTSLTVRLKPSYVSVYAGDTVALDGRVLPTSFDPALTWTSQDESIAAVDENGVVTGLREGTTVITATSAATDADGNPASAQTTVAVKPLRQLDATLKAQITDENGSHWVSISTADIAHPTVLADAKVQLTGGGYHDGKIYGIDGDYQEACNIWMVDPAEDYRETLGAGCSASYSFLDLAGAPAMDLEGTDKDGNPVTVSAFGGPLFLSQARTLAYLKDYEKGTLVTTSWDIASKYGDLSALAFLGTSRYKNSKVDKPAQDYIGLCADGRLVMFEIFPTYNASEDYIGYTLRQKQLGDVGRKFSNDTALSMTYLNDGTNNGLVVSYSDGLAELYYIDLSAKPYTMEKLGNVGTATAISAVYCDTNPAEYPGSYSTTALPGTADTASDDCFLSESLTGEEEELVSTGTALTDGTAADSRNAAMGGAQAIAAQTQKAESGRDGSLTLTLTEDTAVTNGLVEIRYDAALLHYAGLNAGAETHAVYVDEENGILRYAYADADPIAAGSALASLRFTYDASMPLSYAAFELVTRQRGGETQLEEKETITLGIGRYTPAPEPEKPVFEDVAGDSPYYDAILWAADQGITLGVTETTFAPDASCTRAQVLTFLWRAAGSPKAESTGNPFTDVSADSPYYEAILWGVEKGITKGTTAATFAPDATITRGQAATFLYRYAGSPAVAEGPAFPDVAAGSFCAEAVAWAAAQGITLGKADGGFHPADPCTRGQIVTFLYRSLRK